MAETLTLQQIFDKVATHLLAQGERSLAVYPTERAKSWVGSAPECAYRGSAGRMCAAGCLILDEHYDPDLEGRDVHKGNVKRALVASGVVGDDAHDLVRLLQNMHDRTDPKEWRKHLADLALGYELNTDVVAL